MPISINVKCLKAVAPFASREAVRYYLNGALITSAGLIVATDGHKMAIIKPDIATGETRDFILPSETIRQILAVKPSNKHLPLYVTLDADGKRAAIHHGCYAGSVDFQPIGSVDFREVEGTFPDWRRVVPKESAFTEPKQARFNAKYLAEFSSLGDSLAIKLNNDPTAPAVIQAKTVDYEAFAVLMPMRNDTPEHFPEWIAPPEQKPEPVQADKPAPETTPALPMGDEKGGEAAQKKTGTRKRK